MIASRRIAVAATLVVAAAAAVILTRGGEDSSARLDALKADPLARYSPPGARLAKQRATAESDTLGKAAPARFSRWFALPEGEGRRQFEGAVAAARAAGWQPQVNPAGDAATGAKQLDGAAASVVIALRDDGRFLPADVPPPALTITLDR